MKNFKLRAWDEVKKVMLEIGLIDLNLNTVYGVVDKKGNKYSYVESENFDEYYGDDKDWNRFENLKLMQFTGLCDKNNNEIYQSDIVYDVEHEEYAVVVIEEGCTWFKFETHNEYAFDRCDILEVVGNIYESPELLKEQD